MVAGWASKWQSSVSSKAAGDIKDRFAIDPAATCALTCRPFDMGRTTSENRWSLLWEDTIPSDCGDSMSKPEGIGSLVEGKRSISGSPTKDLCGGLR